MATNPSELNPETQPNPDDEGDKGGQQPEPQNPEVNDEGGAPEPTLEEVAKEIGWKPKEEYKGPPENWRPAADFIRGGREVQSAYAKEIKSLRSTVDTVARTSAQILEDRLAEQRAQLTEQFNAAVEEGDGQRAFKLSQDINGLQNRTPQMPPAPEVQTFKERNGHWLGVDPAATARAVAVSNELAAQGASTEAQLKAAERVIRAEYPEHFKDNAQVNGSRPAYANPPAGRSGTPGSNRAKTFSDMPKAAQDIAIGMAERGVIPTKEAYAERYWQNAGEKR